MHFCPQEIVMLMVMFENMIPFIKGIYYVNLLPLFR